MFWLAFSLKLSLSLISRLNGITDNTQHTRNSHKNTIRRTPLESYYKTVKFPSCFKITIIYQKRQFWDPLIKSKDRLPTCRGRERNFNDMQLFQIICWGTYCRFSNFTLKLNRVHCKCLVGFITLYSSNGINLGRVRLAMNSIYWSWKEEEDISENSGVFQ